MCVCARVCGLYVYVCVVYACVYVLVEHVRVLPSDAGVWGLV